MNQKYFLLIEIALFALMGIFIAFVLSIVKLFTEDTSIMYIMKPVLFLAMFSLIVGFIYCELSAFIKNRIIGSIVFGILISQLFVITLVIFSKFANEIEINSLRLDFYFGISFLFTILFSLIYYKTLKKY